MTGVGAIGVAALATPVGWGAILAGATVAAAGGFGMATGCDKRCFAGIEMPRMEG